jgi:hypothetical protein
MADLATRALLRGDLAEADRHAAGNALAQACLVAATHSRVRARAALPFMASAEPGVVAFVEAVAGDIDAARAKLNLDGNDVSAQFAVEAVLVLHETALVPTATRVMQTALTRHPMLRPVASVLGELALLDGRADDAIGQLEEGLATSRSIDAVPHVANAANLLARALDARGGPGDRDRAVVLAAEAQELWHRCSIV